MPLLAIYAFPPIPVIPQMLHKDQTREGGSHMCGSQVAQAAIVLQSSSPL